MSRISVYFAINGSHAVAAVYQLVTPRIGADLHTHTQIAFQVIYFRKSLIKYTRIMIWFFSLFLRRRLDQVFEKLFSRPHSLTVQASPNAYLRVSRDQIFFAENARFDGQIVGKSRKTNRFDVDRISFRDQPFSIDAST